MATLSSIISGSYVGAQGATGSGAQGTTGSPGPQGTTGTQGATGTQGSLGPQGTTGSPGPGTSVNSTAVTTNGTFYPVFVAGAGAQTPSVKTASTAFSFNPSTGNLVVGGNISDAHGNIRDLPLNSRSASYTLVASDVGKVIDITTGGVTIPASVFSAGDAISIFNDSASNQTITASGVTVYLAGTASTGNRTLAQRGVCTVLCVASNTFVISGAGIS